MTPGNKELNFKSLQIEAYHKENTAKNTEFNYHSLHGFLQGVATKTWYDEEQKDGDEFTKPPSRAFLLSRSTFVGQGKFTSHWLGDNHSTYRSFKAGLAGVYNFNAFGIT